MKTLQHFRFKFIFLLCFVSFLQSSGQGWEKTYGGIYIEEGSAVRQTNDSGFIIVGRTTSFGAGGSDVWLIKTNINGDTSWTKTFGGIYNDKGRSVEQTFDGGYIIGGETESFSGSQDIYLIKTDVNGIVQWTKVIGTNEPEFGGTAIQTNDSGYCIVGSRKNNLTQFTDVYLIKTQPNGDTLWTKTYGASDLDLGYSVQQTIDGGFIISGASYNSIENHFDVYLVKTNMTGDTSWTRIINEASHAYGESVSQTSDSGYIIGGTAGENFNAIKTDAAGNLQWIKEIDKGGGDRCFSIIQSNDNGYIMAGYTYVSSDADVLIIKLDDLGNEMWSKRYGGYQWDEGSMISPVNSGGFIIVGTTNSVGAGGDLYLIKTDCDNFPTVNIAVLDTICQGDTISSTLFTNVQTGASYQWTKNDTNIVGATSTSNIVFEEGNYKCTITDSGGCSNVSNNIYINFPQPYFQVYPQEACPGDNILFSNWNTVQDYYPSYNWDFGDGTTDTGKTANHVYQNTGTYIITRTVNTSNGSCNAYHDSVTISLTALPPVEFDMVVNSRNMLTTIACPGDKIEFIPYAYTYFFVPPPAFDAVSYWWDFGDGTYDTIPFPVHYFNQYGVYNITFTVTNHCGNSNSFPAMITIDSTITPAAYFNWIDTQGVIGDTVNACELINFHTNSGVTYDWNFGDGTSVSTNVDSTSHAYAVIGNYDIQLIVTNGCGKSDTTGSTITVDGICTGISSPDIFGEKNVVIYPNPFTGHATLQISPSINNISVKFYDFRIYDLQGRQVTQMKVDKLKYMLDAEKLPGGMYFYKLCNGNEILATGKFIVQ